jgi:predicted dehydrogenase
MKELRLAIVGCGKIADQHAAQIRRVRGARLVAACDREALMAGQLAERFKIDSAFDDVDRMLRQASPDVVHITTPPQSHCDLALRCLESGAHVYVEKPFSIDLEEARRMVAAAESRGLKLTAGHNVQFGPEMLRMREMVGRGAVGDRIVHLESTFSYDLGDASYVRALLGDEKHWVRALPGQLLQNVLSHGTAKIAEFLDPAGLEVQAVGFTSPALGSAGERDLVDEVRVTMTNSEKTTAYLTFTTRLRPPVQELRLYGDGGSLLVDNLRRTVIRPKAGFRSYLEFVLPPLATAAQQVGNVSRSLLAFAKAEFHMDAGMKNLIEAFYGAIRSGGPPPIPYSQILLTAGIMDEVFAQTSSRARENHAPAMALSGGDS